MTLEHQSESLCKDDCYIYTIELFTHDEAVKVAMDESIPNYRLSGKTFKLIYTNKQLMWIDEEFLND